MGAVKVARQLLSSDPLPPQHVDHSRTPSRPATFALGGDANFATTLQLADVRTVKKAIGAGVNVNDVMLCVIGGAFVKYLAGHDGLPDGSLAAMVPKSISDNREGVFGNHFTSMIVSLRVDVNDPVDRARAIRRAVESEVRRKDSRAVQTAERFAERIPGFVLRPLLRTAADKPADIRTARSRRRARACSSGQVRDAAARR